MPRRYLMLTAVYCVGLFWLSSQPPPEHGRLPFPGADKVVHGILYAGLTAIVSQGLRRSATPRGPRVQFFGPVLFALAYGISDEIHQVFVPGRSPDVADVVADTGGAIAVQLVLCGWLWRKQPAPDAPPRPAHSVPHRSPRPADPRFPSQPPSMSID